MSAHGKSLATDRAAKQKARGTATVPCSRCGAPVGLNPAVSVVRHLNARSGGWCAGAGSVSLSGAVVEAVPGEDEVAAKRRGYWARRSILPKALELVGAVREEHRLAIGERLAGLDRTTLEAVVVVLAALVPEDRSPEELLSWISWDDAGRPVGRGGGREQVAA